jgi:acyl-CoA synthetase (AMP-forming)/AMP-acid ligase II
MRIKMIGEPFTNGGPGRLHHTSEEKVHSFDRCLHVAQADRSSNAVAIAARGRVPLTYHRLHQHMREVVSTLLRHEALMVKEIINRGGEKIAPSEVDEVLLTHPCVAEAITFAVPHATLGEDVAAAVVLRDNVAVTDSEIRSFSARQ